MIYLTRDFDGEICAAIPLTSGSLYVDILESTFSLAIETKFIIGLVRDLLSSNVRAVDVNGLDFTNYPVTISSTDENIEHGCLWVFNTFGFMDFINPSAVNIPINQILPNDADYYDFMEIYNLLQNRNSFIIDIPMGTIRYHAQNYSGTEVVVPYVLVNYLDLFNLITRVTVAPIYRERKTFIAAYTRLLELIRTIPDKYGDKFRRSAKPKQDNSVYIVKTMNKFKYPKMENK